MNDFSSALTIISAMITPAVLILATGSLLLTTSQRLNRTLERLRKVYEDFENLSGREIVDYEKRKTMLKQQVPMLARRSWLLQKAMSALYLTLTVFITTSVVIGVIRITGLEFPWIAAFFTLAGTTTLLYSSLLLISESKLALQFVNMEMSAIKLMVDQLK